MKIALAQTRVKIDRPADNLAHIGQTLTKLKGRGVELAVFPPLMLSGRLDQKIQNRPGLARQYAKVFDDFLELSRQYADLALASSVFLFEDSSEGLTEEVFVIQNGLPLYRQRRIMGGFAVSPKEWPVWLSKTGVQVRVLAQGDNVLPGARDQAEVLINLTGRPFEGRPAQPPQTRPAAPYWELTVTPAGWDGQRLYEGATTAYGPDGGLKAWASGFFDSIIELDIDEVLADLDPRPYRGEVNTLHEALVSGIRSFIGDSGFKGVVLGLSGGIDSAVVAALAVEALGPDQVLGLALPSAFNAPESLTLAQKLADALHMKMQIVPIDDIFKTMLEATKEVEPGQEASESLARENLQPRIRTNLLMYTANRQERLLLATGNKSEASVGYCTIYGDTCGALAPIGDVYKGRVYELAAYINRNGEIIPEGIITRPPSAELKPDQKDQDTLPPYEILDDILIRHLEGRRSGSQIAREGGHSPMTVAWALSALKRAAFKRTQAAPALPVSSCPLAII